MTISYNARGLRSRDTVTRNASSATPLFDERFLYRGSAVGQVVVTGTQVTAPFTETFLYRPDGSPLELLYQRQGQALARRFGLDLPPVVRYVPTDLPITDVHLEQLDSVFELDDGSLLHLEFQTEHRRETLKRFLLYDAYLYDRFERPIHTLVIYGADVAAAASELAGGVIRYSTV